MAGTTFTEAQLAGVSGCSLRTIDPTKKPGSKMLYLKSVVVNPTEITNNNTITPSTTDTYQALEISTGEVVVYAGIDSHIAGVSGALCDLDIGAGSGFLANQDLGDVALPAGTGYGNVPLYVPNATAKDTLDVLCAAQLLTNAEFRVWALIIRPMRGPANYTVGT